MRIKTQRKLLKVMAGLALILGFGFLAWTMLQPSKLAIPPIQKKHYIARTLTEGPTMSQLAPLLVKNLQAPLDPPKPIDRRTTSPLKQVVWPKITLDCIFFGQTKLAVIMANSQIHTCVEGDTVAGISIDKIHSNAIEVTYEGERRTIRATNKSGEFPVQ